MGTPRNPVRPAVLDSEAARLVERGHITTSSEFMSYVQQRKVEAERRKADYQTEVDRFEAEIRSRLDLIADEDAIIARAVAALTLDLPPKVSDTPAPQLTEHTPTIVPTGETDSQSGAA